MKFKCKYPRDIREVEKKELFETWHHHFALLPRRVGLRERRWLEMIERRGVLYKKGAWIDDETGGWAVRDYWLWEYRSLEEINA